jgi:hypothetical protein
MAPGTSIRLIPTPKDLPTGEPVRVAIYYPGRITPVIVVQE